MQRACRRLPVFFFPQKRISLGLPQQACRPHDRSTPTQGGCAPPSQVPSQPRFPHPPRRLSCPSALILSLPQKAVQKRRLPRAAARAGGAAGQGGKQAVFEGGGATPPNGGSAAGAAGLASAWNCFAGVRPAGEGWNLWKGRGGHRMRGEGRDAELSVCPGNGESDDLPDAGGAGRGERFPMSARAGLQVSARWTARSVKGEGGRPRRERFGLKGLSEGPHGSARSANAPFFGCLDGLAGL